MSNYAVASTQELTSALQAARAGDTILLSAGTYSGLALENLTFASAVTIKSADSAHMATLTDFSIQNSQGLAFSNLDFKASSTTVEDYAFRVTGSSNISFDSLTVHGSMDNNAANDENGFLIRESSNVSVTNSDFQQLFTAINHLDDNGLKISGNTIHEIRMDGVRGAGSSNVEVSNNHFYNFRPQAGDHDDAIQFWTVGAKAAATNIVISGNDFTRGTGDVAQGIFIEADGATPISGIHILNNTITGGMYNGIAVFGGSNLEVAGNTVVSYADMQSWIRVEGADNVSLNSNKSSLYIFNNLTHFTETGDSINATVAVTTALPSYAGGSGVTTPVVTTPVVTTPVVTTPVVTTPVVTTPVVTTPVVTTPVVTAPASNSGPDTLSGSTGHDTINGGDGDDLIVGASGAGGNVLRGEGGNDSIVGGSNFDDMNGNLGQDTLHGGEGDDWVVGGQDNDVLYGDNGADLVYGNVGADTVYGGAGADIVRGGQGDDTLDGGDGDDFLSGDRGADTISGGAGADTFNFFAGSGVDRVVDFNASEGDHVRIEGGAAFTVNQVGADTVIDLGNGDAMTLVGVKAASLPVGWLITGG